MAGNGRNPLGSLQPLFIDFGARFAAEIHFGAKNAGWANLNAAFAQVRRTVKVTSSDSVTDRGGWRVTDSGFILKVQLGDDVGFDKETRERLEELVKPRYTAQATAHARGTPKRRRTPHRHDRDAVSHEGRDPRSRPRSARQDRRRPAGTHRRPDRQVFPNGPDPRQRAEARR